MAANVQHYICWKFAGRLLDRVNTPLELEAVLELVKMQVAVYIFELSNLQIIDTQPSQPPLRR